MRLMIVDDSEDARDVLLITLAEGGFEDVVSAHSGQAALDLLGVGKLDALPVAVDMVMLDVMMPGMDGIEVCARIRQDHRYQDVPIVMVTSMGDMTSVGQAFIAGANDYVVKPFQRVELMARVRNALKLKGELDRRRGREDALRTLSAEVESGKASETNLVDHGTGLIGKTGFEGFLRDRRAGVGWVAVLQIDALPAYRLEYGEDAAGALIAQVSQSLAAARGPLGALLCAYEPGVYALTFPMVSGADAERTLQRARLAVFKLKERHRDSPAGAFVTVSGALVRHRPDGRSLADAMTALAQAAGAGGDQIIRVQDTAR